MITLKQLVIEADEMAGEYDLILKKAMSGARGRLRDACVMKNNGKYQWEDDDPILPFIRYHVDPINNKISHDERIRSIELHNKWMLKKGL